MKHKIYHLIDPTNGIVRYIGKSKNPKGRLQTHIAESKARQNTEKKAWIYNLLKNGFKPLLYIASAHDNEESARIEESRQCHLHKQTIFNLHDPAKGAKAIRKKPKAQDP